MTTEELIAHSLAKPGAEETFPWGPKEMVVMYRGKAYATIALDGSAFGVRHGVPPAELGAWQRRHPTGMITESFLLSTGWGRFPLAGMPDAEVRELVDNSYTDLLAQL